MYKITVTYTGGGFTVTASHLEQSAMHPWPQSMPKVRTNENLDERHNKGLK